ncbi:MULTISPECIES: DUF4097 family beta strand repeat-containing protein [Clostridium]|uniref:DUF4097 domain-containing protein n=2 Tax=Clostridium TaxID=1485 RepID=A0A1S9NB32_CLOBE|nr:MULTISPECIES: DUF4097 family beta strand repeat-containing protein [Clostridium]MBC2455704.1 DUF4097 domain-containing protein [Clostridium beijerinckii]MBC2473181.1 DUF4097 domain-containing protein [Clostridium beijerinckii]MBN7573195.1 DUF4097 family beta strand repeat protein [Clostridium beijerinckii]MBN7578534.1 DUF4097 family beta strand repeat protein [Clostridium beijerinckii]MBN7582969.1 DUF4097 family beta strand repeat protein [Clostridium beijerinckii]
MKKKFISSNMKIFMLILLLLSITFYTSGCIALVQSGYKLSNYADELHLSPSAFEHNLNFNNFNLDFNTSYLSKDYVLNDNVNEIDFSLNSQDIKVVDYDGDDLKVQIKSNNNISNDLYEIESGNRLAFNARYDTPSDASISVSIPYNFKDKSTLKITTSSGDINISSLSLNTLNLSSTSGSIALSDSFLNYLDLNSSNGNITFDNIETSTETKLSSSSGDIIGNGNLGSINGNTLSGDINLRMINSLNNMSLSSHSGSIHLSIPEGSGYKINYETKSGSLNSPNDKLSSGDESSLINITTESGNLNIK